MTAFPICHRECTNYLKLKIKGVGDSGTERRMSDQTNYEPTEQLE